MMDKHEVGLIRLQQAVGGATTVTRELMSDIAARGCARLTAARGVPAAQRIERLIENEAWVDAALALVALELPGWGLRHLLYEAGEWSCSLSRHPQLPDWLDDAVEARHETLALAILAALVEARRVGLGSEQARSPTVPTIRPTVYHAVSCDNFA
jgi:hypothetical protein